LDDFRAERIVRDRNEQYFFVQQVLLEQGRLFHGAFLPLESGGTGDLGDSTVRAHLSGVAANDPGEFVEARASDDQLESWGFRLG
jgi:hypothetical protein